MTAEMKAPKSISVPGHHQPRELARSAACDKRDKRIDDVGGERCHDGRERAADDDGDRQVHHVAAVDEVFELP